LIDRPCPVCGSEDRKHYANNDWLDYDRCGGCGLIYMNPVIDLESVRDGFCGNDELINEYFDIVSKDQSIVLETAPDPLTDGKLKDIFACKQEGKLLDVGCSFGAFLQKAKFFYDVEGVEINPRTAEYAGRYFKIYKDYLSSLNLPADYDIVTLHQVLYGVPDPVGLLRDIRRVLKDDGILYINTPNADSYAMEIYGGKANHLYGYTSLNVFNFRSLEKLAEKTGFILKSFRTEWLDIYIDDLLVFMEDKENFIHKKNTHVEDYIEHMKAENELQMKLDRDLGCRGNYIVAVLEKNE